MTSGLPTLPEIEMDLMFNLRQLAVHAVLHPQTPPRAGELWFGAHKLQEEMHELGTVLAKLGPYPHGNHPSPEYTAEHTLIDHLAEESADVMAALLYLVTTNAVRLDVERVRRKLDLFRKWGMTGYPDVR